MEIRKLRADEKAPMELLLLADPSEEMIKKYVNAGECFVAESKQQIVGIYVLFPTKPDTIELVNVAVVEDLHGSGIGKQLVMHAIKQAKIMGYKTLEVGTGNSSIGQLALYQKCGFRITEIEWDYFVKHYPEKIVENGIWCRDRVCLVMDL
ncbi:GNAT family N-acetyltransferase [Ornithinibacillus contaminans]|uniref:GNAT family N-acetyltransferase n=1 Tax=Ornithinibacillus contaminans TaxID=694055 RepID=UPI00064DE534|nr:GNAT family N-acetyltransferase [Ornithinibacillus contaminans]